MANIEVSLSPKRKKNGNLNAFNLNSSIRCISSIPKDLATKENFRNALKNKENVQSLKGHLSIPTTRLNALKKKIKDNYFTNNKELSDTEKKQAEVRLNKLKTDVNNKRLTIKNLKMALDKLDISDNIDIRIQQAEREYQLGREELNLLSLLEEIKALQLYLDQISNKIHVCHTLFSSIIEENEVMILKAIEVIYDAKSPKFVTGQRDSMPGLWVDWALEETGLCVGDRLIEVNGKIVATKNRDDLTRLLLAAPDPAQIVILRKLSQNKKTYSSDNSLKELIALRMELEIIKERAEAAQKTKEELQSDNIRLTHRISYLEEQISNILSHNFESSNIIVHAVPSSAVTNEKSNVANAAKKTFGMCNTNFRMQSFLKNKSNSCMELKDNSNTVPARSRSSLSSTSTPYTPPSFQSTDQYQKHENKKKHRLQNSLQPNLENHVMNRPESNTYGNYNNYHHHHHHHHGRKDCSSETNSTIDHITIHNKNYHENKRNSAHFTKVNVNDIMDQSYKKATKIVHDLTKSRTSSLYSKHRQKCPIPEKNNPDILSDTQKSSSVLDFRSEIHIGPKYWDSKNIEHLNIFKTFEDAVHNTERLYKKVQSVKSLEIGSDCNSDSIKYLDSDHTKSVDYTSEPTSDNRKLFLQEYFDKKNKTKPSPPKKPVRLSLQKTCSLQSVEIKSDSQYKNERKFLKRNYKGDVPIKNFKSYDYIGEEQDLRQISWNSGFSEN